MYRPLLVCTLLWVTSDLVSSATLRPPSPSSPESSIILPLITTTTLSPSTILPLRPLYFWNKEEYPNPLENPKFCNRTIPSLLCDPDSLLTKEQASKLDHLMSQTSNVTKCYCKECPPVDGHGIKVAIALVHNIFKQYNAPVDSNSEEFANHLRHRWQFGICDNSLLILFVAANNEITISMGVITQKVISDQLLGTLVGAHRNEFEAGHFYDGLVSIIGGIRHHIVSSKAPTNLDHDGLGAAGGSAIRGSVGDGGGGHTGTKTAVAVVGIVVGFMLVLFILVGSIILAKKRFQAQGDEPAVEEDNKPEGYWSTEGGHVPGDNNGGDQVDAGPEEPRTGEENDSAPPPLPTTPPPVETTPSTLTRKFSTPNGVVEYEPVSIEDDEPARNPGDNYQHNQQQQQLQHTEPNGQEETMQESDHSTAQENEQSRL